MIKKILVVIIVVLIPIYIISFHKKTNFLMTESSKKIYVNYNNETYELDDYVYHVVAAEVPALFHEEAIKAQILATRTYTYYKIYKNPEYIFKDTDQAFKTEEELQESWQNNYSEYSTKIKKLIKETEKEIITYENEPIKAYYFSMSNGYTSDVAYVFGTEEEYLKSVAIDLESNLPNYQVSTIFTETEMASLLNITKPIIINDIKRDNTNRVLFISINDIEYEGTAIRNLLNLRSTDFTIEKENNNFIITTTGYGHGVGMSQYGANELAKQGFNYKEILKKYYTNTEITKINE